MDSGKITVVGGNKGGSGKTTEAVNIAVGLALRGEDVCLVNGDLQRTAAKWHAEREASGKLPSITLIEKFDNLTQTLRSLAEKFTHVIVDVAGRNSREFITSGVIADQIIAPLNARNLTLTRLSSFSSRLKQ